MEYDDRKKISTVKERWFSIPSGDYTCLTVAGQEVANPRAPMKSNQNKEKKKKDFSEVLECRIDLMWSLTGDYVSRSSSWSPILGCKHRLASFRLPSLLLLKLLFISARSLNSPRPWCPWPTAATHSLMSGSVDALGWWAIMQNDGNCNGPSPSLALIPLSNKTCKPKRVFFSECLDTFFFATNLSER